jgi:hypothetical protein
MTKKRPMAARNPLRDRLSAWAEDRAIELIFLDPPETFDPAIVGVVYGFGQEPAILYDEEKALAALAKDMGEEHAREWFEFNTVGAWLGEATPRFLIRPQEDEEAP